MPTQIHAKMKNHIQYENEAVSVILLTSHFFESRQAESKWPFEPYSFQTTSNPEKQSRNLPYIRITALNYIKVPVLGQRITKIMNSHNQSWMFIPWPL